MKSTFRLLLFLPAVLAIVGCIGTESQEESSAPTSLTAKDTREQPTTEKAEPWEWQITKEEDEWEEVSMSEDGSIPMVLKPPELVSSTFSGEEMDVSMIFQSADVIEVLEVLLGEILDLNYVISKKVRGDITLRMEGRFYREELLDLIQTALNVNGLALVSEEDLTKVTLLETAKMEPGALRFGKKIESQGAEIVTQIIPLSYIAPHSLIPTLRGFLTPAGMTMAPKDAHAIIVVDKSSNMERLVAMIDVFDVPFFAGKAVKFYDVKHVNVTNLAKDLKSLVASLGASSQGSVAHIGFIPMTDTNKLLVAVNTPEMLSTIDFWIDNMDVQSRGDAQIYIYKLQHKKANSMATILNDLFAKGGVSGTEGGSPEGQTEGGAPGQAGPVTVIPDADSNSLVIKALAQDYQNIRRIIEVMDATPKQVLIEVLIAEVTLNDSMAYGVEYFLRTNSLKEGAAISLQDPVDSVLGKANFPSITPADLILKSGSRFFVLHKDLDAIITLLDTTSRVEVLSTPRIMVRHEQTASIQVGQEEPIITQTLQQPSPNTPNQFVTSNTIQYKDIGVILTVTPRIGENDMITLDIKQEVTAVIPPASPNIDSPAFSARKASTSLVVENGRTIVLGGIIERRKENVVRRVPVISRIPVLGNLFKSQSNRVVRTELLLILTPYIVSSPEEADRITREFEQQLQAIEKLRSAKTTTQKVVVQ